MQIYLFESHIDQRRSSFVHTHVTLPLCAETFL